MRFISKEKKDTGILSPVNLRRYNSLFCLCAAYYYLFYLFYQIGYGIMGPLYWSALFRVVIVLLVISYYVVYGLHGGVEIHLLTMYCLWAAFTRVFFGELYEFRAIIMELMVMVVLFAPGILLQGGERDRYYKLLAGITVTFFSVFGLICIYTAATRSLVINPLTGDGIGYPNPGTWKIVFLDQQPNVAAGHFLISFCLSLTLLPRTKTVPAKAALCFSAIVALLTISLTLSRNAQTWAGASLGLTVGLLVVDRFGKEWKKLRKAVILFVIAAAVLLGVYRLYEPIRKGLWQIYESTKASAAADQIRANEIARTENRFELTRLSGEGIESEEGKQEEVAFKEDNRGYLQSGRKQIYWSALKSIQMDPQRLLIGAKMDEVMAISNSLIKEQATTFHNCFLQAVNEFGLPAVIIIAVFFLFMLRDGIAAILQEDRRFSLQDQLLFLPVIALMGYNMLEAKSFFNFRFVSNFFFFACGMLAGVYHEKTGKE